MAGHLPPLVKGTSRAGLLWLGVYAASSAAGGALTGAAVGWLGDRARGSFAAALGPGFLLAAGLAVAWDLGWLRRLLPERKRQVPASWLANHGPFRAMALYGLSMGSGVVTYITFGGFYALLAWAAVSGMGPGARVMGFYGLAQAVPVLLAGVDLRRGRPPQFSARNLSAPLLRIACAAASGWVFLAGLVHDIN